ncbi:MAG: MBL fold metallo-hydrolase [bacterium]|nr:MBL fold metallo-hydrolase [bacterium]
MDLPFGITTIDTGFVRPGFDAGYLIVEGKEAAFVDVGISHSVPALRKVLQQRQIAPENVKYLIVTHVHLDHAGGAGVFLQELPNAQVVVHPKGARHLINPERLIQASIAVYGEERFRAFFGGMLPVPAERIVKAAHKHRLQLHGRELLFLDTPGHARHHLCVVDERSQGIFTGDTFGLSYREFDTQNGPFIFPSSSPAQFEPERLQASIEMLLAYQPKKIYLAHFGCVEDVLRLADNLHEMINTFITLAQCVDGTHNERQEHTLTKEMQQLLVTRITTHGCELAEERILEILQADITLNVQGLKVWLDRKRKAKN